MGKTERSKRVKLSKGIDRVSCLPKPLLSQILSLLPTKYAVATSLLSKRWKFVWTSITNLNFDDGQASYKYYEKSPNVKRKIFTQFVNRVLLLLNPPFIQNFHLMWCQELCDPFYLDSWICAAIGRTVQNLELHLVLAQSVELPLSHFYCKTLAVLKLNRDIHFNIAALVSICFPNLSTLHLYHITLTIASSCSLSFPRLKDLLLDSVKYANTESVHKLSASCPVLDNLVIKRSYWDNVFCLSISIPSLRSLEMYFRCLVRCSKDHAYKLQIDTPALKYQYMEDYSMCEDLTAVNLSSLLEARVRFDIDELTSDANSYSINILKFIEGVCKVKFLSISGHTLQAINSISGNITTFFGHLMRLELGRVHCCDWSIVTTNLLESMDNLEHLVMKGSVCRGSHSHESWWMEPLHVPTCVAWLTTISFPVMSGECSDELELVRYFLKNAKLLEVLTIDSCGGLEQKLKLMQKISIMPRGSQACQVAYK